MIEIKQLNKNFGGLKAINDVSLSIKTGTITGLIGPNGAGKTTLFNIIAGNIKPSSGKILFNGEDVTALPPHQLFHKGILRTFQIAHEFPTLSVLENLMMVPGGQTGENILSTWFKTSQIKQEESHLLEKANKILSILKLDHLGNDPAGTLSGGQKKLLEIGRTMMVDAKLVLLDEVGAGINRTLLKEIGNIIQTLNQEMGNTFFMIEHDLDFISHLCNPVIVMAEGGVLFEGSADEVKKNEEVIESYLGTGTSSVQKKL